MIKITKLNGRELVVNADLIEFVEQRGDAAGHLRAIQAYRADYGI